MLELFLGQIPEPIFFAIFMILAKDIKEKRILFVILMILEYLLFKTFIHYSVYFNILYTIMVYIILKILYGDKTQVIDIFIFTIASGILVISSILSVILIKNFIACVIINRIVIFSFLFIFRKKINNITKIYKKIWNRKDKIKKPIKSTTFRALNIVIFNIIFYIINICLLYAVYFNEMRC